MSLCLRVKHIHSLKSPSYEISIFTITFWVSYCFSVQSYEQGYNFVQFSYLERLVQQPTGIVDRQSDTHDILNLFLTLEK